MSLENFKNRKIEWDTVNKNFDQSVQIVSGDVNSRTLTIVITDKGEPINLTGYSVKLAYKYIYNDISGFVMLEPTDPQKGEFSLIIPTEMTSPGSIKSNLILLNENLEQVIVSKNLKFISDDSTVTDLAQEVNSKIDDFTKLLLESMPQVMRSELNDLHAQTESNTSNIELKANSSDMTSLQSAMNSLQNKVEAFGITPENLLTIKSLLDAIANSATDSEVAELINSVNVLTSNISLMSNGDYSPKANKTDLESLQHTVNNQTATISTKASQANLDNLQTTVTGQGVEITTARGLYPELSSRLNDMTAKMRSLAEAGPKGVFTNTAELQSNLPNGAGGIYLTSDTGHWYFWNGSAWEDGGSYQSPLPADFVKPTYLKRLLSGPVKIVPSDITSITTFLGSSYLFYKASLVNEKLTVEAGGHYFPIIPITGAQDVFLTFIGVNHPDRITLGLKEDGALIQTFNLKGSSVENVYYFDISDYTSLISNPNAYFEIRVDNRTQSDSLIVDKFLVGKGGIPSSTTDSAFYIDKEITSRILLQQRTVHANINLLTRYPNKEKNITISGNSISIKPEGYFFPLIKISDSEDVYITIVGVNHPDRISFKIKNVATGVTDIMRFKWSTADNIGYLNLNDYLNLSTSPSTDEFELRFDNREYTDDLIIDALLVGKGGLPNAYQTENSGVKSVIVDSVALSSGDGVSTPFKTISEAINSGAEQILVKPGTYRESISVNSRDTLSIISLTESDYRAGTKDDVDGVTISPTEVLTLTQDSGIYYASKAAISGSRLHKVFIEKSMQPVVAGARSTSYNVTIWEETSILSTEKRLVPVMTKDEVIANQGTFTYDGTKIWINPFDGVATSKKYKLLDDSSVVGMFKNINKLELSGINFEGGYDNAVKLNNVVKFNFTKTRADKSAFGNGFGVENSNGILTACTANQNSNDGFNFHGFGDTHLVDCEGHYNFDDGNSHHDGTTGTIVRGEWSYNGKGGCSPTYGSIIHIDGVYSHDNSFGIYLVTLPENPLRTVRHTNCVLKNNTTSDYLIDGRYNILGINNFYTTKTGYGTYTKLN